MRSLRGVGAGWAITLLLGTLLARGLQAAPPTFQDIEESLTCQCGCGLTVHSCNHLQCGSAIPLRAEIRDQLDHGKDKTAILDHFRDKYGEKILSAPTTTGFNIIAWVTPFALVALGGAFVALTLVRWSRRRPQQAQEPQPTDQVAQQTEYEKTFERELKDFDT